MADVEQLRFRRGVMSLVVLALLEREDMYGYQLVEEVSKRSGGLITTQEGSLYPVLYKLEDAGLISSRKIPVVSFTIWNPPVHSSSGKWLRSTGLLFRAFL